ncbi:MAG TPA: hypothetical protein VN026_15515 [Bacteroidia bacterium]|jgi:hypothetical protein|nr:hypothetical protein [Bacteroidia bacterium]
MKKLLSIVLFAICSFTFAQAPQKISYQAVIRNASNNLVISTTVGMRISILQGSAVGPTVYVETQTPMTNINGLVSIEIGTGVLVSGSFPAINWGAGPYFVKTETDPTGGNSYSIFGTAQLNSVPYALYSEKVGSTGQDVYEVFSNGQLAVSSAVTSYALIPGLTQVVNVPAGYKAYVHTDGGIQCTATGNAFSVVDITFFVDAVQSASAGSRRIVAANTAGIAQVITNWSFGRTYSLSSGNHTFEVKAVYAVGSSASTANVSSGSAPQLQGVLTVMLIKQ